MFNFQRGILPLGGLTSTRELLDVIPSSVFMGLILGTDIKK